MKRWPTLAITAVLCVPASLSHAQTSAEEQAIVHVMTQSAEDWNRGDLDAFATSYKHSPDTIFMGSRVSRGYDGMLSTYKQRYATAEARGKLTFLNLEVHLLDARFATVIGNCHIERAAAAGGNADCLFSLVWEKTFEGWKIVLDHSTDANLKH